MTARRVAGGVALVSGLLLVALVTATGLGGVSATSGSGWPMNPGMMGSGSSPYVGAAAIPGAPEVRVEATNVSFSPSEIRLPKNADVNLTLVNSSGSPHDLTVPGLGIRVVARPGGTATVGLRGFPAGRYDAFCSMPGMGMRAVVIVE